MAVGDARRLRSASGGGKRGRAAAADWNAAAEYEFCGPAVTRSGRGGSETPAQPGQVLLSGVVVGDPVGVGLAATRS